MKNKGFTIVESLVAISILVLVIIGVTSAIQTGISSYIFSKDQIIAFYLAQEGFEQIRNIRDENSLKTPQQPWLTGLSLNASDPCYFGKACKVEPVFSTVATECSGGPGNCPVLKQDPSGFFGYNTNSDPGWTDTIFRREIVLTQINSKEISISVTVDWSKGLISRQFKARENLLNWQQ
jgi:competence protein ComGC